VTSNDHESDEATKLAKPEQEALAPEVEDPPVVARMVVEIRSDGFRTIARGALEDASSGDRVAVVARGTTPMALAASLAKTIFSAPTLAKHAVRALIQNRLNKKEP
jgi:hypothetical protein